MRIGILVAAVVAAVLIIAVMQYGDEWFSEPETSDPAVAEEVSEPPPAPVQPPPEPVAAEPAAPQVVLPELNASDEFVAQRFESLDLPSAWLQREGLVRRLAVVIDNAPRGEYPRSQLDFLAPTGAFKVVKSGETIYIDPASYARYDRYLDIVERVDPGTLAQTVRLLQPLISEGLAELGNRADPIAQINAAVEKILLLEPPREEVRLVQPKVLYEFADPELEALSPLQKQALRLGPDNLVRLQTFLRAFQEALGAPG